MRIDVWWLNVPELAAQRFNELSGCLSVEERARAARFVQVRDQQRFAVCRAALRHIVAEAMGLAPALVEFQAGEHGKPFVVPKHPGHAPIEFNLSHSGDWGVVAVASRPVGIDVERIKPARDLDAIMRRFYAESEQRLLEPLSGEEFTAAFYRVWTRKEAYMKATGRGLSMGTSSFEVTVGAEPAPIGEWALANLAEVPAGYAASLVVHGPLSVVVERRF